MAMPRLVLDPTASVKTRIANRRRHGGLEAEWGADGKGAAPQVLEHKLVAMLIGLRSIEDGEYDHLWQLQVVRQPHAFGLCQIAQVEDGKLETGDGRDLVVVHLRGNRDGVTSDDFLLHRYETN
ncbi:hypothetical protein VCV18_004593 [Metarhizium anisopliae]